MTRILLATAALVAAVAIWVVAALPPARLSPGANAGDDAVPGVVHVHTNRSDGRSSPEQIAAIAARAGLRFVVFTDHGDATRKPDPPIYRSGVLCLDAVEISTNAGHLIALGLPAAPYPLAGEAADVLEDVHRLGGFGIAAHPDSPKSDLQWLDWEVPFDGIEIVNLDTAWRVHAERPGWRPKFRLLTALSTYLVRPGETIAALLTDSPALSSRWSSLTGTRRVPMFAGVDAHARLELRDSEPGDNRYTLALPGYEAVFRTVTMRARPDRPLTGDAGIDAGLVLDALENGRAYATVNGILAPAAFEFTATVGDVSLREGEVTEASGPVRLSVRTNAPSTFTTTIWRDGEALASRSATPELILNAEAGPAVYRADIRATDRPGAPLWVLSNPLYLRDPGARATIPNPPSLPAVTPGRVLFNTKTSAEWATEASPASKVALDVTGAFDGRELLVRFGLPGGDGAGEFAAVAVDTGDGLAAYRRLVFTARGERPMRLSVQLRAPLNAGGSDRWHRSVYVDSTASTHILPLDDFRPVGETRTPLAPLPEVRTILFAVDRTNTRPGTSGRFWLKDVSIQ